MIKKLEKRTDVLSLTTPIQRNTHFLPGMTDNGFTLWESAGITTLKDSFEGDRMMSFGQLRLKYKLSHTHLFKFLEVNKLYPESNSA